VLQLVVVVSACVTGIYSLASLLFAVRLLTVPPCPMESASLSEALDQFMHT